jgi:CCR4-Not complex component, Not1
MTKTLLERFIVHRPHPWGALVTFIELLRNPKYEFWSKEFVRVAPEVTMLLERVSFISFRTTCANDSYVTGGEVYLLEILLFLSSLSVAHICSVLLGFLYYILYCNNISSHSIIQWCVRAEL